MPVVKEDIAELEGVLNTARAMAVAARTAPKARGVDAVETLIVYGDELKELGDAMERHGANTKAADIFKRDGQCVRDSHAVLLVGLKDLGPKKADKPLSCGACGFGDCPGFLREERSEGNDFPGPVCMFQAVDLGIALCSACSVAARFHVDNRMMYTIGGAVRALKWMASELVMGIPLSCTGKNIYFDRD